MHHVTLTHVSWLLLNYQDLPIIRYTCHSQTLCEYFRVNPRSCFDSHQEIKCVSLLAFSLNNFEWRVYVFCKIFTAHNLSHQYIGAISLHWEKKVAVDNQIRWKLVASGVWHYVNKAMYENNTMKYKLPTKAKALGGAMRSQPGPCIRHQSSQKNPEIST